MSSAMLRVIALLSLTALALADRAAVAQHHGALSARALGLAGSEPHDAATKELDYDSMQAMGKELMKTVEDMNGKVAKELTKANEAVNAGEAYAELLKEQYAGHLSLETGVKTFRTAVSDTHHKSTQTVRKALAAGKAAAGAPKGKSLLTTENEVDFLKQANKMEDSAESNKDMAAMEESAKAVEKERFDPKALHLILRWQKDVDLDLHLNAPKSLEASTGDPHPKAKKGENFVVGIGMDGKKTKDGWYVEDIASAPGTLLPLGKYNAWATYFSGVKNQSSRAPTQDDFAEVPFEVSFLMGDERKLVKDVLKWPKGTDFDKTKGSMKVFSFTLKDDGVVQWEGDSDQSNDPTEEASV
mmetsp:Transcript_75858/g.234842  ORF Transcript_75858/g.234842 Transcript_75858/m.234842 type:complete len:357 (-) Transcript_75858:24-1094(-)